MFPAAGLPCLGDRGIVLTEFAARAAARVMALWDAGKVNQLCDTLPMHGAFENRNHLDGRARTWNEFHRLSSVLARRTLRLLLWARVAATDFRSRLRPLERAAVAVRWRNGTEPQAETVPGTRPEPVGERTRREVRFGYAGETEHVVGFSWTDG